MINKQLLKQSAMQWIEDWNNRSMENVMSHYADDVQFYSSTVIKRWNEPSGKLEGKDAVERHFRKGLEEMPGMNFGFHSILFGVESIILFYKRESGALAADMVKFNEKGKVSEVRAYYEENNLQ
jgi:SnoaL-like domain